MEVLKCTKTKKVAKVKVGEFDELKYNPSF